MVWAFQVSLNETFHAPPLPANWDETSTLGLWAMAEPLSGCALEWQPASHQPQMIRVLLLPFCQWENGVTEKLVIDNKRQQVVWTGTHFYLNHHSSSKTFKMLKGISESWISNLFQVTIPITCNKSDDLSQHAIQGVPLLLHPSLPLIGAILPGCTFHDGIPA